MYFFFSVPFFKLLVLLASVFLLLSGLVYFVLQRRDELLQTILTPREYDEEQEKLFFKPLQDLQAPEPEPAETNEQAAQSEDNMQWPELPPDVS
jgi:hypothetical protein